MTTVGIRITERIERPLLPPPVSVNKVYAIFIGDLFSPDTTSDPIKIVSYEDLVTKGYATVPEFTATVTAMFFQYPNLDLEILYRKRGDTETYLQALQSLIEVLKIKASFDLGYLMIPQNSTELTTQADFTTVYALAENLAKEQDWVYLENYPFTLDFSIASISAVAKALSSPFGHGSLYFGSYTSTDTVNPDIKIPISAIASSFGCLQAANGDRYSPPAGDRYPIKGIKSITPGSILNRADFEVLREVGVNCLQDIRDTGVCIWGSRTQSEDVERFLMINTRIALSIIKRRIDNSLRSLVFRPVDPQGNTRREAVRRIYSVMEQIYNEQGLSGATPKEAYKIEERTVEETGDIRKVEIVVLVRPVDALEFIDISLVTVLRTSAL